MIAQNDRDAKGRLRVPFFVKLIGKFRDRFGVYEPTKFKMYVEGLGVLTKPDWDCERNGYVKWKHRVDRAAQKILTNI
ncbi:MAG TPA: hypothetical protein VMD27_06905 [Candidatus Aquilonibacter sp.]|nr:hypothetical protein [Candidatus Aquilonibacter sp.]HUB87143.1 hypothetical protein [Verrucomicrobiae bacterium]